MSGTFDKPWKLYTLERHPEVAREYGRYMAAFSNVGAMVYILFAKMLGDASKLARAQAVLSHVQSFSLKLTTVENYLPHSVLDEQQKVDAGER